MVADGSSSNDLVYDVVCTVDTDIVIVVIKIKHYNVLPVYKNSSPIYLNHWSLSVELPHRLRVQYAVFTPAPVRCMGVRVSPSGGGSRKGEGGVNGESIVLKD